MDPARDLADWPNSDLSRMIRVRPHDWHVQETGSGPVVLLIHGAGGSSHSYRDLIPLLAQRFRVVAVDLPGHGFTCLGTRHRSALDTMAQDLAALCSHEGWLPAAVVGHSAGAAVALRLALLQELRPRIVSLNPALEPFRGLAGLTFPVVARMVAMTPFIVDLALKQMATPERVSRLLRGTGSRLEPEGIALYARLFRDRDHVDGVMLMMAQWKLDGLLADLPHVDTPCLFLTGSNDATIPPVIAVDAARRMPRAEVQSLDDYGHLMHEEAPDVIAARIVDWLKSASNA